MSGFAGEITTGRPPDQDAVERMGATLGNRGPDSAGSRSDGQAAFAHRRLALIGTESTGDQPMLDHENGATIVYDGSVYNHLDLRSQLEREGYSFFSTSDTEAVVKAHDNWGHRCAELFAGAFAYAVYEHYSGRLFLVRDRLGTKPLYVADVDGALRFASTLPALLAGGGIDTELDPVALHHYLTWGAVPAPRTILAGVRKLPPATVTIVGPTGQRLTESYWRADYGRHPKSARWRAEDWAEEIRDALLTAVDRRMVSDVPVGVLRDRELEASLILALLGEGDHGEITTFLPDEMSEERLRDALDGAVAAMSEPTPAPDAAALYLAAEEVARSHKVVQTGDGAETILAGDGARPRRSHAEVTELLQDRYRLAEDPSASFTAWHFGQPGTDEPADQALRLQAEALLDIPRLDGMTMAWGVDARTPFLDHQVVELAAACPPELKRDGAMLRAIARGLVPDSAFAVGAAARNPSLEALTAQVSSEVSDHGIFAPEARAGAWDVALLELWLDKQGL